MEALVCFVISVWLRAVFALLFIPPGFYTIATVVAKRDLRINPPPREREEREKGCV